VKTKQTFPFSGDVLLQKIEVVARCRRATRRFLT
jgi:hypothetical protein